MAVLENIDKLTYEEKLVALRELESSIAEHEPSSNDRIETILQDRSQKIASGDAVFHPASEVFDRLREAHEDRNS